MDEKPIYVPSNFSVRKEFWQGFGVKEAVVTAIASIVFSIAAYIVHVSLQVNEMLCIIGVMVGVGSVIAVVQKFDSGLSIVDFFKIQLRYSKEQQKFHYHYVEVTDKDAI